MAYRPRLTSYSLQYAWFCQEEEAHRWIYKTYNKEKNAVSVEYTGQGSMQVAWTLQSVDRRGNKHDELK